MLAQKRNVNLREIIMQDRVLLKWSHVLKEKKMPFGISANYRGDVAGAVLSLPVV